MTRAIASLRERRRLRRLRSVMRGYNRLRRAGQLSRPARLRETLTLARFARINTQASRIVFGAARESAEVATRQVILARFGNFTLNKALLASVGQGTPVVHPLPPEWRDLLESHGFRVDRVRSAVTWNAWVLTYLGFGLLRIGRTALAGIRATLRPAVPLGQFVYFDALKTGNLPSPAEDGRSHDVMTWYQSWPGRVRDVDALCHGVAGAKPSTVHGVNVVPAPAMPPLRGGMPIIRFMAWGAAASVVVAAGLLRGRWWDALMLSEAATAAATRLQRPEWLAREYLFHNSAWIYRPLWTYEAERMGSRTSMYFYSTNCEAFQQGDEYPPISYGYSAMSWPHYIVWDEYQANFVRRAVGNAARISVVGPIWFQSSPRMLPQLPASTIAVFDVQPVRDSYYQMLGLELEYYLPDASLKFLTDIATAASELGGHVAFKRKREVGTLAHPQYRRFVEQFHSEQHVIDIPPDTSAERVVEQSAAVISMAFTSTALIGRELKKPTAFYDPTGLLRKDDRAAHGIEVLNGPAELRAWLASVLDRESPMSPPASQKAASS